MKSPPWPDDLLPELAARAADRPAVILDDDPTGTQTLRDVHVLTAWDADAVGRHLHEPVVFLSTNSRSLAEDAAVAITHDAAVTASGAARAPRPPISIVTRSDILSGYRRRLREGAMQEPSIQLFKGRNGRRHSERGKA